jgi:type I restriction enzyme S subunit
MVEFKTRTVEEVTETLIDYRGKTPPKVESGIRLVTAKVIKDGFIQEEKSEYICEKTYASWMRRGYPRQFDIVLTTEAPLGEVAQLRTKERIALAQRVILLRGNPSIIDQQFFFQAIKSPFVQAGLQQRSTGTTVLGIKQSELRQVGIPYFPLPTQRKIASILSAYDDLIENNLRRIKILEEMAQNLYREWFVKFRFPGYQHTRFTDSPMGQIPEGWAVANFGELYMTSSGGTPSRKVSEYYGGAHPWVKTRELNDGFIFETEETVTDLGLKKSSAKSFPANTVILAIYGATIGKLGILSISSATNQACVAILPKEEGFGRAFSFLFLRENRDKLISLGQGAAQQNISQVVLKNFPALRPPESLMHEFSQMVEPLLDNDRNLQQKNIILRRTRDLLLPRLISGELDVSELDIAVPEKADE